MDSSKCINTTSNVISHYFLSVKDVVRKLVFFE